MEHKTVCVTGGAGFVGSHVVQQLVEKGYRVKVTVRDASNSAKTQHLLAFPNAKELISFHEADLLQAGSFDEILADCVGVFHTASPFFLANATEENLTKPAIDGTLNVLKSAQKHPSIKRIVLTSSTAAVYADFGSRESTHVYTETDWSDADKCRQFEKWYLLGKTLAERMAFDFVKQHSDSCSFDVISMNPTWILGPMLQPIVNESCAKMLNYLNGETKTIPNEYKTYVDVRDVATAHVLGFEDPNATGRYLLISCSPTETEVYQELRSLVPLKLGEQPLKCDHVTHSPVFGPQQPAEFLFSTNKAKALGVSFRNLHDMVEGTVQSFKNHGIL